MQESPLFAADWLKIAGDWLIFAENNGFFEKLLDKFRIICYNNL